MGMMMRRRDISTKDEIDLVNSSDENEAQEFQKQAFSIEKQKTKGKPIKKE